MKATPTSDITGKKLDSADKYFDFTVTNTIKEANKIEYEIFINKLEELSTIKDEDIRIDTYCASGHGGQGVNTTPSAVRITHFPSKIVVTCQNERSQIQNKEQAMKVLKSKLFAIEQEKKQQEMAALKGISTGIDFGSQIRSYVLEPYTLVKDPRSNFEMGDAEKVLDGEIKPFIESILKMK